MDGHKARLSDSLRLRLSLWLSVAILVFPGIAGVISFGAAFDEAHELQDDILRQVAALVDNNHLPASEFQDIQAPQANSDDARGVGQRLRVSPPPGSGPPDGDDKLPLPLTLSIPDGLATVKVGGEPYRVLAKTLKSGERIAVAQETDVRDQIARTSAIRTVMPLIAFVPVLLLVVGWLVRRVFRPVASPSREIEYMTRGPTCITQRPSGRRRRAVIIVGEFMCTACESPTHTSSMRPRRAYVISRAMPSQPWARAR